MLTKEQTIALLHQNKAFLATDYGVKRIGLFGSYAKGQPGERSDVDSVVEFERPIGLRFIELVEYLEAIVGRKVDVLTPAGIQGIRIGHIARDISESIVYV